MIAKRLQSSNSFLVWYEGIDWWEDGIVEMKCPAEEAIWGEVELMELSFVMALWGGNAVAL